MKSLIEELSPGEKKVYIALCGGEYAPSELADMFDISVEHVYVLICYLSKKVKVKKLGSINSNPREVKYTISEL